MRGSITEREIASQPELWSRVLTEETLGFEHLPANGQPTLVVGCGTSYYIGQSWAEIRVKTGQGPTRAAIASELPVVGTDDTILLISRSGTTADVADVGRRFRESRRVIGIIGTPDTPIEAVCHERILLDFADEESVIQTRFATTVLALLRRRVNDDTRHLVDQAEQALSEPLPLGDHRHLVFLGSGWSVGVAHEAALKCLEASGVWAEAYPIREYQHGPIAAANAHTLVWCLTEPDPDLRAAVTATKATLRTPKADPMAELILAQRVAVALAERAGRDPDHPLHLSRSVTAA